MTNKIIAFEGGDFTGKSTAIKKILDGRLSSVEFNTFKFPDYDGISGSGYGKAIRGMLFSNERNFEDPKFVLDYAHAQIDDKYSAIEYCRNLAIKKPLCFDRFLMSPIVYDTVLFSNVMGGYDFDNMSTEDIVKKTLGYYDENHKNKVDILYRTFNDILYIIIDDKSIKPFLDIVTKKEERKKDAMDSQEDKQLSVGEFYRRLATDKSPFIRDMFSNVRLIEVDKYFDINQDIFFYHVGTALGIDPASTSRLASSVKPGKTSEIVKDIAHACDHFVKEIENSFLGEIEYEIERFLSGK